MVDFNYSYCLETYSCNSNTNCGFPSNPISGLTHVIISPCNIVINLSTPCVAGC
jgi:hypothetical protein